MARINNTTKYPLDTAINGDEYVIGSDSPSGVTKNYKLSDIKDYVGDVDPTPPTQARQDGIISGGASWDVGMSYKTTEIRAIIGGVDFTISPTTQTLAASHATLSRFDIIYVQRLMDGSSASVKVETGIPAENPVLRPYYMTSS